MENLNEAFYIMFFGMAGIFIVLGIIYLSSLLLLKLLPESEDVK